jgi:hypothetical protein
VGREEALYHSLPPLNSASHSLFQLLRCDFVFKKASDSVFSRGWVALDCLVSVVSTPSQSSPRPSPTIISSESLKIFLFCLYLLDSRARLDRLDLADFLLNSPSFFALLFSSPSRTLIRLAPLSHHGKFVIYGLSRGFGKPRKRQRHCWCDPSLLTHCI